MYLTQVRQELAARLGRHVVGGWDRPAQQVVDVVPEEEVYEAQLRHVVDASKARRTTPMYYKHSPCPQDDVTSIPKCTWHFHYAQVC